MSKEYKQQLRDLQNGLISLNNIINESKDITAKSKAERAKELQVERILFFKLGYNSCKRELKSQRSLS